MGNLLYKNIKEVFIMKIQRKEKKKILILLVTLLLIAIISYFNRSFAMKNYQEVEFATGLVTARALNVRQGPSLSYKVISKVYKNQYIRVFAKIDNWYIIQTDKDIVGAVYADYVKPIYPAKQTSNEAETSTEIEQTEQVETKPEESTQSNAETENKQEEQTNNAQEENVINVSTSEKENTTSELTADEKEIYDAINGAREEAGLALLQIDDDLQNICRIKAQEMVEKEYFSHQSPTYGSPFEMLKKEQISYKVAGENIAGNSDNKKAVEAWMNSESHKSNIINNSYNYTGIAVVNSPKYGKIYVQMFIGR